MGTGNGDWDNCFTESVISFAPTGEGSLKLMGEKCWEHFTRLIENFCELRELKSPMSGQFQYERVSKLFRDSFGVLWTNKNILNRY
jgi:hypothetical protein